MYDGHGGFFAEAKCIVSSLPQEFEKGLHAAQDRKPSLEEVTSAFEQAYGSVSNELRILRKRLIHGVDAMATNIFIDGSNLYIAHAGDSRVTVCVDDGLVYSTKDHPERIPLSRALGSRPSFKPDVYQIDLIKLIMEGNVTILLYSDGIIKGIFTDGTPPEYMATYVNDYSTANSLAKKIIDESTENGSIDDRTILVVKPYIEGIGIRQKPQPQIPIISQEKPSKDKFFNWRKFFRR